MNKDNNTVKISISLCYEGVTHEFIATIPPRENDVVAQDVLQHFLILLQYSYGEEATYKALKNQI